MSVNKYKRHVLVLPEDDANRQIANGFLLHESVNLREIQVLPSLGGWRRVRDEFAKTYVAEMDKRPLRYMLLLIDFDTSPNRLDEMTAVIPQRLEDRVFVAGVWSEPEDLRSETRRSLEEIGRELAKECQDGSRIVWSHQLLQHNAAELDRMTKILKPFLFRG